MKSGIWRKIWSLSYCIFLIFICIICTGNRESLGTGSRSRFRVCLCLCFRVCLWFRVWFWVYRVCPQSVYPVRFRSGTFAFVLGQFDKEPTFIGRGDPPTRNKTKQKWRFIYEMEYAKRKRKKNPRKPKSTLKAAYKSIIFVRAEQTD